MNKIEELKARIEGANESLKYFERVKSELEAELKELEKQENQEWKPQINDSYWYINLYMMITVQCTWYNREIDNIRLQHKVIFKTREEAEEYLEYLQVKEKAMNEFSGEWNKIEIKKYYIEYNANNNNFQINWLRNFNKINALYFRTEESAQEFINKYEKFMKRELEI